MMNSRSFPSTRRRLSGSAAHSVFSQHNLRSAAPSSTVSTSAAPPAPPEADLFDPNPPKTDATSPKTAANPPTTSPSAESTSPKRPISSTIQSPTSPNAAPQAANTPPTGTHTEILPKNDAPTSPTTEPKRPKRPISSTNQSPTTPNAAPTQANTPPTSPNTPQTGTTPPPTSTQAAPTRSTPGSASSTPPPTDAPCGPSAKLAVVPFATWPTVASHSDTPEAERPHWRARLLEHYSPERQVSFGEHPEWCYSSPRPTLRRLRDQLGSETVVTWLCLQLNYAAQLWGTADGLTSHQLRGAAEAIGASYAELNVGEVMVYLCRLRGGRYGKVAYGSLSADAMVSNLPLYMKERREELSQHERRAADRALAEELDARAARCCTHAQYEVLHARARVLAGGDEAEALRLLEERFWETDTGAASPAEAAR